MNAEVFEKRNAAETTYGACDGPSCLWRSVGGSVVQLLKEDGEVWPSVGLRSLWRSVVAMMVRLAGSSWCSEKWSQYPDSKSWSFLERDHDGPLCLWRSVILAVEGNEDSSKRNCRSKGWRSQWRSVVTMTIRRKVRWPSRVLADFQQIESLFN